MCSWWLKWSTHPCILSQLKSSQWRLSHLNLHFIQMMLQSLLFVVVIDAIKAPDSTFSSFFFIFISSFLKYKRNSHLPSAVIMNGVVHFVWAISAFKVTFKTSTPFFSIKWQNICRLLKWRKLFVYSNNGALFIISKLYDNYKQGLWT